ncbi:hypothetical protein ACFVWG_07315 [Kribbella sp. NPDC058245]|uniref:hypothetical protein n=1 Tax=Kribbella sp. NPDC058245 TaxID=3346399 RepID=UPI0036E6D4BD
MRKIAVTAAAAAVLTAGLQVPAWAAAPAAPTDVTVGWSSGKIQLTWKDAGEANNVYVEYPGTSVVTLLASVPSTDANDVVLATTLGNTDRARLVVKSVTGSELSEGAATPEFDTQVPGQPVLQDASLATNLTTQLKWSQPAVVDPNPGDPLDLPATGETLKAFVDLPGAATNSYDLDKSATSATIPAQARPASIQLLASNEWGTTRATKSVRLGTLGAGITVPSKALYSDRLGIKSTIDLFTSEGREERASGIPVELQARAKTTDAWKTYGRYAGNTTAVFDTGIASLGNRQYRLWVPARKVVSTNVIALTPATSTSAKSSTTLVKFVSGGFSPSVVRVGGRSTFSVKIAPAVTVKAHLQAWTGSSWVPVVDVPLTKGSYVERGDIETDRYTLRVRIVVPTIGVNGLTVNANTSPAYNLTVK